MKEIEIQDAIRLELGNVTKYPLVVWRNNVGQMIDANGRRVVYGLGKGSADLVGIWTHANGVGQYVEIEIKTPIGKQSPEQAQRQQLVEKRGGVYVVLRSVEDARRWAHEMRTR